jgi:hypothetical protein
MININTSHFDFEVLKSMAPKTKATSRYFIFERALPLGGKRLALIVLVLPKWSTNLMVQIIRCIATSYARRSFKFY